MKRLLITGAGGFVGGNLAESLQSGYDVVAPPRSQLDLLDDEAVREFLRSARFDAVVHCATVRSSRKTGEPPGLLRDNCRMFFNFARNSGLFGKMICFGSGAEYDSRYYQPRMPEEYFDTHVPEDSYGFSKYICAKTVSLFPNVYELRLFAVFGPHESWEVRFLSNACCRAVWDLPIVIRQNVYFDFLDVKDLGRIVEWFINHSPRRQHYNVCSGKALDLKTYAQMVLSASGKRLDVVVKQDGLGQEYSGDNRRLLREMGGFAFRDIGDSIEVLYRWYSERRHEIDPALLGFDS